MSNMAVDVLVRLKDRLSGPLGRLTSNLKGAFARIGKFALAGIAAGFAAIAASLMQSVRAAAAFEEAFADVKKVADFANDAEMATMRDGILDLSRVIPIAADGLASITAEAIQSGIEIADALDFTEMAAQAGVAFDMLPEVIGETFAKIKNVFQLDLDGLRGVADAVNHLSNNMAAKAPQILDFLTRAGGAAPLLGMTAQQISALGASMIALGTVPETAGRAVTMMFTRIATGGKKVDGAFEQLGMERSEFIELAKADPGKAFTDLFEAVGKSKNGLKALVDLVGQDFAKDFLKLANNPKLLAEAFGLVGDEAAYAGSVLKEYGARAETFINSWQLLKNNLNAIAIETGSRLLPTLNKGLNGVVHLLQTLGDRITLLDKVKAAFGGFAEGLGLDKATGMIETFKSAWTGLTEFLFGRDLSGVDEGFARVLRKEDQTALSSMVEGFRKVGAAIRTVMDLASSAIEPFRNLFATMDFDAAKASAASGMADAMDALGKAFDYLKGVGGAASDGVMTGVTAFLQSMSEVRGKLGNLPDKLSKLGKALDELFGGMPDSPSSAELGKFLGDLAAGIGSVTGAGIEVVASSLNLIVDAATQLVNFLSGKPINWSALEISFADQLESNGRFINAIFTGVEKLLGLEIRPINWSALQEGLKPVLDFVFAQLKRLEGMIDWVQRTFFKDDLTKIKDALAGGLAVGENTAGLDLFKQYKDKKIDIEQFSAALKELHANSEFEFKDPFKLVNLNSAIARVDELIAKQKQVGLGSGPRLEAAANDNAPNLTTSGGGNNNATGSPGNDAMAASAPRLAGGQKGSQVIAFEPVTVTSTVENRIGGEVNVNVTGSGKVTGVSSVNKDVPINTGRAVGRP